MRFFGDSIRGYDVVSSQGSPVGRVERSDPSGAPHTRPSGWWAIPPGGGERLLCSSRMDAAGHLLWLEESRARAFAERERAKLIALFGGSAA